MVVGVIEAQPLAERQGLLTAIPDQARVLVVVAVVIVVIAVRFYGEPVQARRLFLLPPVFLVLGVADFVKNAAGITGRDVAFLVVATVLAAVTGWARGRSVALFEKNGYLWLRYRVWTLVIWLGLGAVRLGLDAVAHAAGADAAASGKSLMLMLGVTLVVEAAVVIPRAHATGVRTLPVTARTPRRLGSRRR
jgi:membrane protein CcdC involved in cytochrome C biogenesis